jgi:hypothetical protein
MPRTRRRDKWTPLIITLLAGAAVATAIALMGAPEMAWLGLIVAGLYADTPRRRCRGRRRVRAAR